MRFLIADDHPLFREVVAQYLHSLDASACVFETGHGNEVLALIRQHHPFDLVLLDIAMPGPAAQMLLAEIMRTQPGLPVVFVSSSCCAATVARLMAAGARGYVSKDCPGNEFGAALQLLIDGERYVSPAILARLEITEPSSMPAERNTETRLTPRQFQVLALLQRGLPNKAIARQLGCSEGTVKLHVSGILRALRARNRTEAVAAALRHGLLDAR